MLMSAVKRAAGGSPPERAAEVERRPLLRPGAGAGRRSVPPAAVGPYDVWRARNAPSAGDLDAMGREVARLRNPPLISVVTPVYDVAEVWLRRCIDSLREQVYPRWELCVVDDGSKQPHVERVLAEYAARDPRIRYCALEKNSGIVAATSRGVELARGDFVAFLDHDDELAPDALYEVALRLEREPDLDLIYTDEDRLDPDGRPVEPFFKPGWSPDLLMSLNYVCHLAVYRAALLRRIGGVRPGFEGSQDWDLVLRFTEQTTRIAHIPKILYHWRQAPTSVLHSSEAKPYAFVAGQKALEAALERRGRAGRVEMLSPGRYRTAYAIDGGAR